MIPTTIRIATNRMALRHVDEGHRYGNSALLRAVLESDGRPSHHGVLSASAYGCAPTEETTMSNVNECAHLDLISAYRRLDEVVDALAVARNTTIVATIAPGVSDFRRAQCKIDVRNWHQRRWANCWGVH